MNLEYGTIESKLLWFIWSMMMMMITPCGGKLHMDVVGVPILCQCVIWSIYSLIGWRDQHVRRACPHPIYIYNSIYGQVSGEIRCSYISIKKKHKSNQHKFNNLEKSAWYSLSCFRENSMYIFLIFCFGWTSSPFSSASLICWRRFSIELSSLSADIVWTKFIKSFAIWYTQYADFLGK